MFYRWTFVDEDNEWHGVVSDRVWRLRQRTPSDPVCFHYSCSEPMEYGNEERGVGPPELVDYFRLNTWLGGLVQYWRTRDKWFTNGPSDAALGIRLLRQDPVETLFAFITSANNNVPRISRLLTSLGERHGKQLEVPGVSNEKPSFHYAFPDLETLASTGTAESLRNLGFGYRSRFIQEAARYVLENGGVAKLHELRNLPLQETRQFLINIPGIGNKVADCICLSSLDAVTVVPVDVHMLEAARYRGLTKLLAKKMKPSDYETVSKALSNLWGDWAGWAQAVGLPWT